MSLSSALFAGVSGLNTLGNSMAVIGDNIANVNTIGFKSSRSTFETVLAQSVTSASGTSQVGRGVALSAIDPSFTQGSFESTQEATDMAIGGSGFFMVRSPETGIFYTRAGHFKFDEEGYLVNPAGMRVQGWILDPTSPDPKGAITDILINATSSSPNATSEIQVAVNLDTGADFTETPPRVESDTTTSGFMFQDGVNDSIEVDEGGGAVTIDLVTAASSPLSEETVYTGQEVAAALQTALNNDSTLAGTYTVAYDESTNKFTLGSDIGAAITGDPSTSTAINVLGFDTEAGTDLTVAAAGSITGNEVAYNVTSSNNNFTLSTGQSEVSVILDEGTYTIDELRKEIEDEIVEALGLDSGVDVRYNSTDNTFSIETDSRGGSSTIQVGAGETGNFLPTVNLTDTDQNLAKDSDGRTVAGFTESKQTNTSAFIFDSTNDDIVVTGSGTVSLIGTSITNDLGLTETFAANTVYTGEEVAQYLEAALGSATFDVSYDEVLDRFTIQNNGASGATIEWSNAANTAAAVLGFSTDADDTISAGGTVSSDSQVAFNIITGQNDTLDIVVNGNEVNSGRSISVTVDAGAYTGDTLAQEIEDKINAALGAAGETDEVKVSYSDVSDRFSIASTMLGPNSTLQVNKDSGYAAAQNDLFSGTLRMDDTTVNYGQGFQVESPDDTANYSSSLVVYDTLGNQHTVTFYFRKALEDNNQNTWEWFAYVPATDTASDEPEVQARGTLTFNERGIMTSTESNIEWLTKAADGSDGTGFDFGSGAEAQQNIDINFGFGANTNVSTQFSAQSSTIFQTQDGYGSGFLQDVSTDTDGIITGHYSNGQVLYLARVALANFTNPWGLSREGGNLFSENRQSGQPITGTPGTAGMGKIAPNSLEQSNVDLSEQFVNMIIQQRGFQANSRIITTTDSMLAELLNLKR